MRCGAGRGQGPRGPDGVGDDAVGVEPQPGQPRDRLLPDTLLSSKQSLAAGDVDEQRLWFDRFHEGAEPQGPVGQALQRGLVAGGFVLGGDQLWNLGIRLRERRARPHAKLPGPRADVRHHPCGPDQPGQHQGHVSRRGHCAAKAVRGKVRHVQAQNPPHGAAPR